MCVGGKANKCSGEKTEITEQEGEVRRGNRRKEEEIIPLNASDVNLSFPYPNLYLLSPQLMLCSGTYSSLPDFLHLMFSATTDFILQAEWVGGNRVGSKKEGKKLLLLLY